MSNFGQNSHFSKSKITIDFLLFIRIVYGKRGILDSGAVFKISPHWRSVFLFRIKHTSFFEKISQSPALPSPIFLKFFKHTNFVDIKRVFRWFCIIIWPVLTENSESS